MINKYNANDFKITFEKDEISKDVFKFIEKETLVSLESEIIEKTNDRSSMFVGLPKSEEVPFVNAQKVETEKGFILRFQMGWTRKGKNGEMPDKISSKTAFRKDNKPSMIKGVIEEDGTLFLDEVLFSEEHGFKRYIFDKKGNTKEAWLFKNDNKSVKIYELKQPMFVSYYKNGEPNEVWFSNPKALNFIQTSATIRMSDDLPVVITFYDTGHLKSLDYTGFPSSDDKVQDIIQNFPFNSRKRFYLPSYYFYTIPDKDGKQYIKLEKYFLNKTSLSKNEILSIIGTWGVDVSTTETIEKTLKENPIFEDTIRNLRGIAIMTDEELDETIMLHSKNK